MLNWLFKKSDKKDIEQIKNEVKGSFSSVKDDIEKLGQWINHLNNQDNSLNNQVSDIKQEIASVKDEIEQIKEVLKMVNEGVSKQLFKTPQAVYLKQTAVLPVQTAVQTAVQTGDFYGISNLSVTERAIIWLLVNNDLKLSYEDLAAMLGKTKSTIRGQINSIKQKSEGIIEEYTEKSGKKRVYIPEETKEKLLKKAKVRVQKDKKEGKNDRNR